MNSILTKKAMGIKTVLLFITLFLLSSAVYSQSKPENDCTEVSELPEAVSENKKNTLPEFPGGKQGLATYLSDNIRYPRNSRSKSIRSSVIVCFTVEENGEITKVKIVEGINSVLNKEAIRVVANMPNWKPAYENGVPTSMLLKIPIVFFRN